MNSTSRNVLEGGGCKKFFICQNYAKKTLNRFHKESQEGAPDFLKSVLCSLCGGMNFLYI